MMRNTVSALLAASVLTLPSVAVAQAPRVQGRGTQVQPAPRVVVERQQGRTRVEQRDNRGAQTERLTHTFRIGGSGALQVSNITGDITITRGGGNEVRVEAVKTARARTEALAREALPGVRVDFTERAGRAEVKTIYPAQHFTRGNQRNSVSVSVAFNITAPEGTRIHVKSISGDITVKGIRGELAVASTSGDIGVFDAARLVSASSISGDVEVGDLRSETALELHTTSGDLIVRQSRMPRLKLNTVSGSVVMDNVQAQGIEAQSLSGDLEFASPFVKGGRYELNSHSGDVRIRLVGGSGFELNANSFSGGVQSAVELKEPTTGLRDAARGGRTRRLRGTYGDGSALLDITTFSGSVTITKK
jgi:DUF4097 and DUF4098 domain-containing protein YvlB